MRHTANVELTAYTAHRETTRRDNKLSIGLGEAREAKPKIIFFLFALLETSLKSQGIKKAKAMSYDRLWLQTAAKCQILEVTSAVLPWRTPRNGHTRML